MAMTSWGKDGMSFQPLNQRTNDLQDVFNWMTNSRSSTHPDSSLFNLNASMVASDLMKTNELEDQLTRAKIAQARQALNPPAKALGSRIRGAGIGFDRPQAPRNEGSGGSSWEREQMDRQRSERDFQQQRKQGIQTKKDDMGFLQQIMSMYGGGSGGGRGNSEEGYTEQIFNNAGAPQVVRLKNESTRDSMGDILKMLMSKYG